jgi:hypothetical protein
MRVRSKLASSGEAVYDVDGSEIYVSGEGVRANGDAQICLGLLPSLMSGSALEVDLPVDPQLLRALPDIQEIFGAWLNRAPVEVMAEPAAAASPLPGKKIGSFFSGGVDSFYTAIREQHRIDSLIFVQGFDIAVDDVDLYADALRHAQDAAAGLGRNLLGVSTNVRQYAPIGTPWIWTHGSAMAAVAHSLDRVVNTVLFPATSSYSDLFPLGTHPLTDPLWGGGQRFEHHGAAATRFAKIKTLSEHPVAASHLRVCWENRDGKFNCGDCPKCVLTMSPLAALGVLERFQTFQPKLSARKVALTPLRNPAQVQLMRQTVNALAGATERHDLVRGMEWCLRLAGPRARTRRLASRAKHAARRWN